MSEPLNLRDYFAAHALGALIGGTFLNRRWHPEEGAHAKHIKEAAKIAYEIADAMVAEQAISQPDHHDAATVEETSG